MIHLQKGVPMTRTNRIVVIALYLLVASLLPLCAVFNLSHANGSERRAAAAQRTATVPAGIGSRVVINGCGAEDACAINYHPNGTWTVRRDAH
jgi:hypothetical protein